MQDNFVNGMYNFTIILISKLIVPQIYYPIKNCVEFDIDEHDYEKASAIIKEYHNKANIIIDSRMEFLILSVHLNFPDYCLIYDINTSTIIDVITYLTSRSVLDLQGLVIYTKTGQKLVELYMFIRQYCPLIPWNITTALDICERNDKFIDILLNYVGIKEFYVNETTKVYVDEIRKITSSNFSVFNRKFDDNNTLFSALTLIKNVDDSLRTY